MVNWGLLVSLSHITRTRDQPMKLKNSKFKTEGMFFTQCIINLWTSLSQGRILSKNLTGCKTEQTFLQIWTTRTAKLKEDGV